MDARLISYKFSLPTINDIEIELSMTVEAIIFGEALTYKIGAVGKSVALNSLAALTAAKLAGFDIHEASRNMAGFRARKNTLDIFSHEETLFFDCSHNLEIPSILAAFDMLKSSEFSKDGRRIVVISRIVNMGEVAEDFHLRLEYPLMNYGFDQIFIHNPDHEWDKVLPRLPRNLIGGVSTNATGTISDFVEYVRKGDSVLILGASRGCDFGEVLPGILRAIEKKFDKR